MNFLIDTLIGIGAIGALAWIYAQCYKWDKNKCNNKIMEKSNEKTTLIVKVVYDNVEDFKKQEKNGIYKFLVELNENTNYDLSKNFVLFAFDLINYHEEDVEKLRKIISDNSDIVFNEQGIFTGPCEHVMDKFRAALDKANITYDDEYYRLIRKMYIETVNNELTK